MGLRVEVSRAVVHIQPDHLTPESGAPVGGILGDETGVIEVIPSPAFIPKGKIKISIRPEVEAAAVVVGCTVIDGQ